MAEIYLSGEAINASGNSVAWCQAQYQAGVDAYAALGWRRIGSSSSSTSGSQPLP